MRWINSPEAEPVLFVLGLLGSFALFMWTRRFSGWRHGVWKLLVVAILTGGIFVPHGHGGGGVWILAWPVILRNGLSGWGSTATIAIGLLWAWLVIFYSFISVMRWLIRNFHCVRRSWRQQRSMKRKLNK